MSKNLKDTARGLASLGRGPDTMLVHMAPAEVEGLQALAVASGGSLTINPHTGLPEAGWLSTLLPIVAGGAATFLTGGAASPWLIAALGAGAGGVGAKAEGEDPLMGAAMGALGGFGGSGPINGLMNAGRAGQVAAGTGTVLQNAGQGAAQTAAQGAGQVGAGTVLQGGASSAAPTFAQSPALNTIANAQQTAMPAVSTMNNSGALQAGLGSLGEKGAVTGLWKGMTPLEKMGTTTAAMGVANEATTSSGGGSGKKSKPYYYHTSAEIDPNGYVSFGPGAWDKQYDYERLGTYSPYNDTKYAIKRAEGGQIPPPAPVANPNANQQYMANLQQLLRTPPPMPTKPYQQPMPMTAAPATSVPSGFGNILAATMKKKKKKEAAMPEQVRYSYDPVNGFTKLAGGGGIAQLPEAGRFVKGPGDGISDSIPAVIDGQQPAALSNNEFVVDAMTMAKLGNGSPEAGAQKMYQWQKAVHSLPTAPGKDLKAEKYLPT